MLITGRSQSHLASLAAAPVVAYLLSYDIMLACSAQVATPTCRSIRDITMDIDPILPSIVAVRATIPDDAFTAAGLGTLREGSGVVIRENGLVLTIG